MGVNGDYVLNDGEMALRAGMMQKLEVVQEIVELNRRIEAYEIERAELRAQEVEREIASALEKKRFSNGVQPLKLVPGSRARLASVLAMLEPEHRSELLASISEMELMAVGVAGFGGEEGNGRPVLTEADWAVIRESARLEKKPIEEMEAAFSAARARQIKEGRYRGPK